MATKIIVFSSFLFAHAKIIFFKVTWKGNKSHFFFYNNNAKKNANLVQMKLKYVNVS